MACSRDPGTNIVLRAATFAHFLVLDKPKAFAVPGEILVCAAIANAAKQIIIADLAAFCVPVAIGEIISDLTSIGIDRKRAEFLASAQTYIDKNAERFVKYNKNIINLTNSQKQALLQKIIGKYENDLKKVASFPVTQYQFDALVALSYNAGGPLSVITRSLAAGNVAQAEKDWLSRTHSRVGSKVCSFGRFGNSSKSGSKIV